MRVNPRSLTALSDAVANPLLAFLVSHAEPWQMTKHWGLCGQNCPCCRAANDEDYPTGCRTCREGFAAARLSRGIHENLEQVPRCSAKISRTLRANASLASALLPAQANVRGRQQTSTLPDSGANGAGAQRGPGQPQPDGTPFQVMAWADGGEEHHIPVLGGRGGIAVQPPLQGPPAPQASQHVRPPPPNAAVAAGKQADGATQNADFAALVTAAEGMVAKTRCHIVEAAAPPNAPVQECK